MGKQFDELAKALAAGVSRREALRRFAAGAVGGALAAVIPGRVSAQGGNSTCAQICQGLFPEGPERDRCVSASTKCPPGACDPFGVGCDTLPGFVTACAKHCRKVAGGDPDDFRDCIQIAASCPPGTCPDSFLVNGTVTNGLVCVPA